MAYAEANANSMSDSKPWIQTKWIGMSIAVWFGLILLSVVTGIGVLGGGMLAYVLMGAIIGVWSPGNTMKESGIAAFFVGAVGFALNNILLTVFVVGIIPAIAYGIVGMILAMFGGYLAESF